MDSLEQNKAEEKKSPAEKPEKKKKAEKAAASKQPKQPKKGETADVFAFPGPVNAYRRAGFKEVARRSETRPIMRFNIR